MQHFKKNILAAALLCGFTAVAGAQNAGSTAGTTAATPSTSPVTGTTTGTTTATITTESGRTATADIPTTTAPNTGVATTGTPSTDTPTGVRHEVNKPAAPTVDTEDTRGSSVAAQARENRGQGQDTAAAVRAANPSSQNAQSDVVAAAPNFDTLDINKDGWVALSELPVGNTQLSSSFPDLDADGDSRLSRTEFEAVLTADSGEMDEDSESE